MHSPMMYLLAARSSPSISGTSDVLNAYIRTLDDIDSYYMDPCCNIIPTQT